MIHKSISIVFIFLFCLGSSQAQNPILRISAVDSFPLERDSLECPSLEAAILVLEQMITEFKSQNYIEASLDSLYINASDSSFQALVFRGPAYDFDKISLDSINPGLLKQLSISQIKNQDQFIKLRELISESYGETGYPFAKIRLKQKDSNTSYLVLDKGPFITVDSITINGSLRISKNYISRYLVIEEGSAYRHSFIEAVSKKLSALTFTEQYSEPRLTFFGNYSTIDVYLHDKNASRFDLMFGIIPTSMLADRSTFLSLDFTAEMLNRLGSGEYIFVDYERLRPGQQKFEFQFNYPYFLRSQYGIDVAFSIFRLSLDYQTLISDLGLEYIINDRDKIKFSWNYESSNIVEIDSTELFNTGRLPEDLDVSQNGIAISLNLNRLDYRLNPRSGYSLRLRAGGGLRSIKRNSSIIQLKNAERDFSEAYDSLQLSSSRFEVKSQLFKYFPVAQRATILTSIDMGWRYSSQDLYRNEKFQLGGNKLLRGFDEAQFFSSYYLVTGLAYRILLSNNSYISIPFVDFGYLEDSAGDSMWALGFGTGIGIETGAGLFQFSIASGRTENGSFDFRRPKVHLGFSSLF